MALMVSSLQVCRACIIYWSSVHIFFLIKSYNFHEGETITVLFPTISVMPIRIGTDYILFE